MVRFDPANHTLVEGPPIVDHLRRRLRAPELACIRFRRTGKFSIVELLDRRTDHPRFKELAALGSRPVGSREVVDKILRMTPGTAEYRAVQGYNADILKHWEERSLRRDHETIQEGRDASAYLQRKAGHKTAHWVVPG